MDAYNEYMVKCWTCNDLLSCFAADYEAMVANGTTTEEALNNLGLTEPCCRALMLNPVVVTFNMENREVINGLKSVDAADYPDARPVKGSNPIFTHCRQVSYRDETVAVQQDAEANQKLLNLAALAAPTRQQAQPIVVQPTLKVATPPVGVIPAPTVAPKVAVPPVGIPLPTVVAPKVAVPAPTVVAPKVAVPLVGIPLPTVAVPPVGIPLPTVAVPKVGIPLPTVAVPPVGIPLPTVAVPPVGIPVPTKAGPLTRPLTIGAGPTAPIKIAVPPPKVAAPVMINPIVIQGLQPLVQALRPVDMNQLGEGIEVEDAPHQFKWPVIVGIPTINEERTLDRELVDVGVGKHTYILTGRTYLAQ